MDIEKKQSVFVGIDPGLKGYVSIINRENGNYIDSFPLKEESMSVINPFVLADKIKSVCTEYDATFIMEDVHAIFGASASSTFTFGWVNGMIEGVLCSLKVPYSKVQPKTWQKVMFEGVKRIDKGGHADTKQMSYMCASRLYPNVDLRRTSRCKVFDDNKCDSLLIANYAKRIL